MKVSVVEQDHIQLDEGHGRTSGIHVSGVIRAIAVQMGYLDPEEPVEEGADPAERFDLQTRTRICLGLAFEEWLSKRIPGLDYHFGEVVQDGIIMSPDGFSFMPDAAGVEAGRVHEFKLTWKSQNRSRNWIKEWMWLAQMKSYCRALSVLECWLHVYWINGDYSTPGAMGLGTGPCYEVYRFEFTEREVELNWKLILDNAHKAKAERHGN